jgi:hypothetical protein
MCATARPARHAGQSSKEATMKTRFGLALGGVGLLVLAGMALTVGSLASAVAGAAPAAGTAALSETPPPDGTAALEAPETAAAAQAAAAQAAAERYLSARSAAVLSPVGPHGSLDDPTAAAPLLVRERLVVRGKLGYWRSFGERPVAVSSRVVVDAVEADEAAATVNAYVYTTVILRGADAGSRQEGEGIAHRVALQLVAGGWQVITDDYLDTAQPAYLRCADAPAGLTRSVTRRLVDAARARELGSMLCPVTVKAGPQGPAAPQSDALALGRMLTTITFNRAAAVAYADKWTSEADVTGISHYGSRYNPAYYDYAANGGPGDCTPYASQCISAGGYPFLRGWYYEFGNPFAASPSWYNNNPQRSYLNLRYFDKVASVTDLKKGDLIYYDWNADGYLDHTAVYVGIYDGVRCVDAHTTDHRHHAWKLGGAGAKYHFYSIRDVVRWPLPSQ